jgi:hypothetical protein
VEVSIQVRYPDDDAKLLDLRDAYEEAGADHLFVSFSPGSDTALVTEVATALARS